VVVAGVIAGLAALSNIAGGGNTRSAETRDSERLAALAAMDEALARQDLPAAAQAWQQARRLALRSRGWRAPMEAVDAELRLAVATDRVRESKPSARELLLITLFRARAEGDTEGAVCAAERFGRLGDHDAAQLALRIAENLATRQGDRADRDRVRLVSERIQCPVVEPTALTRSGL
jgi:hypothetical protein